MAGYVNAVRAIVCFEFPAREASSFCDFWKLISCDFITFNSSLIEVNFCFLDVLIKDKITLSVSKNESFWCGGFQWMSLWRSDKFLLTLSVYAPLDERMGIQRINSTQSLYKQLAFSNRWIFTGFCQVEFYSRLYKYSNLWFLPAVSHVFKAKKKKKRRVLSLDWIGLWSFCHIFL